MQHIFIFVFKWVSLKPSYAKLEKVINHFSHNSIVNWILGLKSFKISQTLLIYVNGITPTKSSTYFWAQHLLQSSPWKLPTDDPSECQQPLSRWWGRIFHCNSAFLLIYCTNLLFLIITKFLLHFFFPKILNICAVF